MRRDCTLPVRFYVKKDWSVPGSQPLSWSSAAPVFPASADAVTRANMLDTEVGGGVPGVKGSGLDSSQVIRRKSIGDGPSRLREGGRGQSNHCYQFSK